ncbi:phosphate signaling complex protein PhoU [Mycolicibacterium sediminis]|uniref:Phosphate transport system regulatory protein PhoU n=1 Tax=Mycolicibacterium sediminis TaxID=1286180 RepID=A0A7I7QNX6_9MYCO|nr:phosphate signaling complex protein PhoU [Mycolicibacterium sediminis]BBY27985.1 phosphate transport system regulatory protein PhoU [Mycolicibacterium sediminis]
MRADYHRQLDALRADLGRMCALAGSAAGSATDALLAADLDAANRVSGDVERLRALEAAVERQVVGILARQAPVARDLREVVTAIQIAGDADRMGGLAAHIARVPALRHPARVVPDHLRPSFVEMGSLAVDLADRCRAAVLDGTGVQTEQILDDDDAMESLHRGVHRAVMQKDWSHGATAAIDAVLLGRFYGRFADHAGEIARRVRFQTTGAHGAALV